MAAFLILVRSAVRGRWRALLVLTLIVGLACSFVLTAVDGARRAHTAWDRLGAQTDFPDALLSVSADQIDAAEQVVRTDPAVLASAGFSWIPANPQGVGQEIGMFAGIGPGFGTDVVRPLVESGRLPDPSRADEISVNRQYADLVGVSVGSIVHLVGPAGLQQKATVVGIHRSPLDIGPNGDAPNAMGTPALMTAWRPKLRSVPGYDETEAVIGIRFRDDGDQAAALRRLAQQFPGAGIVPRDALDADVRQGISAATTAYAVLALAAAVATVLLLGFVLTGMVGAAEDPQLLAALGASRGLRALVAAVPTGLAVCAGVLVAPLLAVVASPLVRTGFTAIADPETGRWFEAWPLVMATVALLLAMVIVLGAVSWRVASSTVAIRRGRGQQSRRAASFAASPPVEIAACSVLGLMRPATRLLARSMLVAVAIAAFGAIAAFTWRSSVTQLTEDYRLQGWSFDAVGSGAVGRTEDDFARAGDRLKAATETVTGLTSYWQTTVSMDGDELDVFALTPMRGHVGLAMLSGRLPSVTGEVVASPALLRSAGKHVGDGLDLPRPNGDVHLRIVGEAVFPLIGNTGFGTTLITDPATAASLGATPLNEGFLIDIARGATAEDVQRIAGDAVLVAEPSSPPAIQRLLDAVGTDTVLGLFFAALGLAVFAFGLLSTTQRQRIDYAVTRALGFRRRQVVWCFAWQAVLTLLIAGAIAVPTGIALGRAAWKLSSRNVGVLDVPTVDVAALSVWVGLAIVCFVLIASAVSASMIRATVATGLHTE